MEVYFIAVLCLLLMLYIVYTTHFENQQVDRYEQLKIKHVFYCSRCDFIYTCLENIDVAPCPKCSHDNTYLKF